MKTNHKKSNKKVQTSAAAMLNLLILFSASEKTVAQNTAGIVGIDHVGINVPDLNKAVAFFNDVLGFTPVTQLGPIPLDAEWKKMNHINPATGAVTIKMINAGNGASIEVFEYTDSKGSLNHPNTDDIGASHIAFYVEDINAAVQYLKNKGVKVLGEPFTTPSGDTAGESWVYFETPWGSKMELVSYPNGKGYEKNKPAKILWSPKKQIDTPISESEIKSLVDSHLLIWNEKEIKKREDLMKKVYNENIEMVDSHFVAVGYKEINEFIDGLHNKNKNSRFSRIKAIDVNHNTARLYWQHGSAEKPDATTGMDLFVFENGKVVKLYVFVDNKK
ncbi:MAG: VOC family protein [Flavobacterium nitrogenifigens]|uniref:Catechol 2,3-dioxygenase n=1 Tax=Flavobacterium nitrogenifigens TaxID=1617283 RepID=A0A521ABA8_9FLAO|nr:VOC family protein [Flavobacterium nitrogenifigens]KAF2331417.1 glyoxalase [Flavobacterium nitrogenifigens]MDQ8012625.1 VOC family protein [Flavobacterium nitrogenifigens]SMO32099.1 Catechol 2,3-dioxygenase [Flavobacterium nitrogenifigens]